MDTLLTIAFSALSCLTGAFFVWQVLGIRHARELEHMDRRMASELGTTLSTYGELELRVHEILRSMSQKEAAFNRRLAVQRDNICGLQEALSAHGSTNMVNPSGDLEAAFQQALEPISAAFEEVSELPSNTEELGELFDQFESQADQRVSERIAMVDEQSEVLAGLTARTRELEPLAKSLSRQTEEIAGWKRLHEELSTTNQNQVRLLQECIDEFQPIASGLQDQEETVERWRAKLAEAENEAGLRIGELESRLGELEPRAAELSVREKELEEARGKLGDAQAESGQWQSKCESAQQASTGFEADIKQLRSETELKTVELGQLMDDIASHEKEICGLKSEVAKTKRSNENELQGLEGRIRELKPFQARVTELEGEMDAKQCQLRESQNACADLSEELEGNRQQLQTMEERFEQKSAMFTEAQSSLNEAQSTELNLRNQCEGGQQELKGLREEFEQAQQEQVELKECLESTEQKCAGLQGDLEQATARGEELSTEVKSNADQLKSTKSKLKKVQSESKKVVKELNETTATLEGERQAASEVQTQLETSQTELETSQTGLAKAAEELERSSGERGELQVILDQVEAAKSDLQSELALSSEAASAKAARVEELQLSLAEVCGKADSQQSAMADQMSNFQQAKDLLEAMRPMMEGLENTLRNDEREQE